MMPPLLDSNQNIIPVLDLLDIFQTINNEANATLAHMQRQRQRRMSDRWRLSDEWRMPIENQAQAQAREQPQAQPQAPMQPPQARLQPQGSMQQMCRHCLQALGHRIPQQSGRLFPAPCCAVRRTLATPSMGQVAKPNYPSNGCLGTSGALVPFGPNVRPTIGSENGGSVPQPRRQVAPPVVPIRAAHAQPRRSFGGRLPTAPEGQRQGQRQVTPTAGRESLSERARRLMGENVLPGALAPAPAPAPHGYNTPLPMLDHNPDFRRCEYFLAEEDTHVGDDHSQLSVTNGGTGDGYFVRSNKENLG
ncbi:uncharacterized protein LOC111065325 [Drosophila obscura]|uniref:uncharacterized protein LOC111065325 n=1 Tax=Drosophila obscura TaxID=7282 RepID=UPI001BB14D85|nr:uncharacterized protein LOC111065325 [Drosophila obscura]